MASDLAGRYHTKWYGGSRIAREIIETTEDLAKELFKVKYALVTPLSGNMCNLAVLFAFTLPRERVAMVPLSAGGYPLGVEKFHREHVSLPVCGDSFDIDVPHAKKLVVEKEVKLTILGSSYILFPQPVREISVHIKESRCFSHCVYDGSHVLG